MKKLAALITATAATVALAAPVDAGGPDPVDLAGMSFAVEVTVLRSSLPDLPAGASFENCYTFHEVGTWSDPAFPAPEAPVDGTWTARPAGRLAGYVAVVDGADPLVLHQYGVVVSSPVHPTRLVARTTVTLDGDVVLGVRSVGTRVESCDQPAGPQGFRRPVTPVRR
ncbi:MAG: hypothetical protein KDB37_05955 [Ilumatobacter sp.]|nr:hypothetical protein [Ilumatobacter sp.]